MSTLVTVVVTAGLVATLMVVLTLLVQRRSMRSRIRSSRTLADARGAAELVRLVYEEAAPVEPPVGICDHVVQLFGHEDDLVDSVSAYLAAAINDEEVAVVIATAAHRSRFEEAMVDRGVDVAAAQADGSYVALDAAATAAKFIIDGSVNRALFHWVVDKMVREASRGDRPVRAYGEMVALLWEAGHVDAAVDLEALWNELLTVVPFSLFCAYPRRQMDSDAHGPQVQAIRQHHSAVLESAS